MRSTLRRGALCLLLTLLLAPACRRETSEPEAAGPVPSTEPGAHDLDACAALGSAGLDEVLGGPVGEPQPQFQVQNEQGSVSQCRLELVSGERAITLLLRHSSAVNPRSQDELAAAEASGDVMGMGEETAAAIRQGKALSGLGDLAFSYELISTNVMVLWSQHYQMIVMADGFADPAEAATRAETVARRIFAAFAS